MNRPALYPKVIVHIGCRETDEAAFQRCLHANQTDLLAQGILYPKTGRIGPSHNLLAEKAGYGQQNAGSPDIGKLLAIRDALREEIIENNPRSVIVSSALFSEITDLCPVADLFRHMPVQIVVCLRRHDHWWESMYRRAVTDAFLTSAPPPDYPPGFASYLQHQHANSLGSGRFRALVDRWADCFGKQHITVVPMEATPENTLHGTLERVAQLANINMSHLVESTTSAPASLPRRQIQLMEIFLRARVRPDQRERLHQHASTAQATLDQHFHHSPPRRRLEFLQKNARDYEYIAREFIGREDGRLFVEPPPEVSGPWEPPHTPDAIECVEEVAKALGLGHGHGSRPSRRSSLLARWLAPKIADTPEQP